MKIVLVEDNLQLATTIADGLSEEDYTVDVVGTAAGGIDRGLRRDMDLMVLDLGLPDRDGLEVLRELRSARINVPILVLTARDAVEARVAALHAGADDYLIKPFAFAELVARIAALARRAAGPRWAAVTDVPLTMRDDLVIESGGRTIALSPREYALFGCLLRRRGEVVARAETPARRVRLRVRSGHQRDRRPLESPAQEVAGLPGLDRDRARRRDPARVSE